MKKFLMLFVLCGLVGMPAWGGHFSEMKSYLTCGKSLLLSENECYSVGNGRYVECDDDSGDAPAKTRAYWYSDGVWSSRCYISGSRTGDDYWTDRESVSICENNACGSAYPREKLPDTDSMYICGKQNQGIKSIGNSVFVGGGSSDAVDCYFLACDKEHYAATSGDSIPSSSKRSANCGEGDDPNASECEDVCVENSGVANWVRYVTKCKDNMKPGGFHNFGYTKCEADAGSSVVAIECPAGFSKNITSQKNCNKDQKFECKQESDGKCVCGKCIADGGEHRDDGKRTVGKCDPSVCVSDVCRECCKRPATETFWDREAQFCRCTNKGTFQKENDGTWICKVEAGAEEPVDTYVCDAGLMAKMEGWRAQCAAKADVLELITELEGYCNGRPDKDVFLRLYDEVADAAKQCVTAAPIDDSAEPIDDSAEKLRLSRRKISDAHTVLRGMAGGFKVSQWKDEEGKFNTARLASDSVAAVVLGTTGALVTSNIVKKNQVENGFEDIKCAIGGQTVADWGDQFRVGIQ